jgi:hypothetical protein
VGIAIAGMLVLGGRALGLAALAGGGDVGGARPANAPVADDGEVHGGPIERFHGAGACDLVAIGALPGNWTHGDYMTAVEALGDPALLPIAAHTDCGKPAHAGGPPAHAGGPPAHAAGSPAHAAADDLD